MLTWNEALTEYQRITLIVDAIDSEKNEPAFDAAADVQGKAIEALLSTPAPDLAALAMKLGVMKLTGNQHLLAPVAADVERLGRLALAAGGVVPSPSMLATSERCGQCRFWLLDMRMRGQGDPTDADDISFGRCRRSAPVVRGALAALAVPRTAWGRDTNLEDEDLTSTQIFRASPQPVTESADWCGEYVAMVEA